MCLSKVYIVKSGIQEMISESVCNVVRKNREITLYDIIGQTTIVRGEICSVDLLKNKIIIEEDKDDF
ncbi:MAG: CooT family nickel-binding protein [Lachnospiraceae bacterium]|nr:CooT family nickel-binding protein [Lachnospiraceae bacterium]